MTTSYDEKSYELAEHFLSDMKALTDEQRKKYADRLAQTIQSAVEDELDAISDETDVPRP